MKINHAGSRNQRYPSQRRIRIVLLILTAPLFGISVNAQSDPLRNLLADTVFRQAHVGVFVYDFGKKKVLLDHNGARNFIPASNTKLFTLYAGLKYLGDSLPACSYAIEKNNLLIAPTGDPTFLHPDFMQQPLLRLMQGAFDSIFICLPDDEIAPYGQGWAWDDYDQDYQAENNRMPVFGNCVWINRPAVPHEKKFTGFHTDTLIGKGKKQIRIAPAFFAGQVSMIPEPVKLRERFQNRFYADSSGHAATVPFITNGMQTSTNILSDLLRKPVVCIKRNLEAGTLLRSVPVDSLFAPMMQHSDNFFAEQTLLMASDKKLGKMHAQEMIDSLLSNELHDLPDRPEWVDGSGLSRYNLFTPRSMVYLLGKLQAEFGLERLKRILPTGGSGTLKHYYLPIKDRVYAKTGSVSNHFSLSGYLYTQTNRLLFFSVMTGSFPGKLSAARRAVEQFVTALSDPVK